MKLGRTVLVVFALALAAVTPALSQISYDTKTQRARSSQPNPNAVREAMRENLNESVLFLLGGQLGAAYIEIAQDIAIVVNSSSKLRVMPVVSGAGLQNVKDMLLLRGMDMALTTTQVLNHLKATGEAGPNLERQIAYIAPLFHDTLQVVASAGIDNIEDLKGKRVNFNNKGSGTALFAPQIFKGLGIDAQESYMTQGDAILKMRSGELDATVCLCPLPIPAFSNAKPEWGFKLLEVPFTEKALDSYLPADIQAETYPSLIAKDGRIETIATSTVLVTFDWPKGSTRYNRTVKFVDAFFSNISELQKPPRHSLWKTVNIAATIPGWNRFSGAQDWLNRNRSSQASNLQTSFQQYVAERLAKNTSSEPVDNDRLFGDFLEWMRQNQKKPTN
jgi:uncharacterized protein